MKSVLITGGAGFIGSHLCERFLHEGYAVFCSDNLSSGRKENIENFQSNSRFHFSNVDITKELDQSSVELIVHLACRASPSKESSISYLNHPLETIDVNTIGTRNLLEVAKEAKARFVFASTSEVYGQPQVHPQDEAYFGNVNSLGVRAPYDESKRLGETICSVYHRVYGIDTRITRIFNTYGPRMNPGDGRMIINFVKQALKGGPITIYGDGKQTRSLCFVSDLVDGIHLLSTTDGLDGEVINLGSTEERTVLEVAEAVINIAKSDSKIVFEDRVPDDPLRRRPDISKAKRLLGWSPRVSFEGGIEETIEFYRKII